MMTPRLLGEPGAVVCVGESGLNALAIIRSLGRRGIPVHAVAMRESGQIASCSRYCSALTEVEDTKALYWALRRIAQGQPRRPVLFIDNDIMLRALAPHAASLGRYYEIVDPLADALRLTDKQFQLQIAREAGIPVPQSWYPRDRSELSAIVAQAGRRLIAKPLPSSAGKHGPFKVLLARHAADLQRELDEHSAEPSSILVQEFIEGGDAALYSGYGYRAEASAAPLVFTSRKLRQSPASAGVMAVGEPFDSPQVRAMTAALMDALGYRGMLSVEFKREAASGAYYFVEWNPRFDACHSLGWLAGFDAAYLAYLDHAHRGPPAEVNVRYDTRHTWINVECELRNLVRAPGAMLKAATWRPYLGRKEWALFAADDAEPYLRASARTARWMWAGLLRAAGRPLHASA